MSIFGTPQMAGGSGYPVNSVSATIATAIGDLVVVFMANLFNVNGGPPSCTDTAGNTYTSVAPLTPAGNPEGNWFYCLSATHASPTNTITVTTPNTGMLLVLQVFDIPITGGPAVLGFVSPAPGASLYVAQFSYGSAYPNLLVNGTDSLVLVTASDTSRISSYTAGPGYTLAPPISGPYPAGLGAEWLITSGGAPQATYVQSAPIVISGPFSGNQNIVFPGNVTKGNTILVEWIGDTSATVSDSQGNVYTAVGIPTNRQNAHRAWVGTTGPCTVTLTGVSSGAFFIATVAEIASPGPESQITSFTGSGSPTTAAISTQNPNSLLVSTVCTSTAPGTSVTYSPFGSETIAQQAGNSADGFAAILDRVAATVGGSPYTTGAANSAPSASYQIATVSMTPGNTPFMTFGSTQDAMTMIVFTGASTHSISGNAGTAGATVSFTGPSSGSVVADGSGNYTIPGLNDGTYTVTPSLAGFIFSPTSQSPVVAGSNVTGVNFTASAIFTISGNAGTAGATLIFSGPSSGSVIADGSGNYSIPNLVNGTYTITPSLTGFTFSPTSRSPVVSGGNVTGVNFTATAIPPPPPAGSYPTAPLRSLVLGPPTHFPYGLVENPVVAKGTTDELPVAAGEIFIVSTSANAMTLALPRVGDYPPGVAKSLGDPRDDGKLLLLYSITAFAHTVTTPTNGINGSLHLLTFGGAVGDWVQIKAFNGTWWVMGSNGVTAS